MTALVFDAEALPGGWVSPETVDGWFDASFLTASSGGTLNFSSLTATLSFVGADSEVVGKALAAALSFVGARAAAARKGLTAVLSFAGAALKRIVTARAAALSFAGAVTGSHLFLQA